MRSYYVGGRRVDVQVRDGVQRLVPAAQLARVAGRALDAAGARSDGVLGLILSDDQELSELNEGHMGKVGPTDVLSFPMLDPGAYPHHPGKADVDPPRVTFVYPPRTRMPLGFVVVSVERAIDQAEAGRGGQTSDVRWDARDELCLLVTHGTLHVCGWDHAEPEEEAAMRALERRLLAG